MTDEPPDTTEWDDVSFVISSGYREGVLGCLAGSPATPSQLAADSEMTISHASRALSERRERSLVELLVDEERRKGRIYGLTDRGTDILAFVKTMDSGTDT